MLVIEKSEFLEHREKNIELIQYGAVFIYPTDTIYGIGCDARSSSVVKKIREIKQSFGQPFSVIAPSKEWIKRNLAYEKRFDPWLSKLPGPYTLIMNIKNKRCVSRETTANLGTLGVRIPDNWFAEIVSEAGIPIITTSVNLHGSGSLKSIGELPKNISSMVDFAIDDGTINGTPSTIVDLTKEEPTIMSRGK